MGGEQRTHVKQNTMEKTYVIIAENNCVNHMRQPGVFLQLQREKDQRERDSESIEL